MLCGKPQQGEMVKVSEDIKLTALPLPGLLTILKITLERKFIFVQDGEAVIVWEQLKRFSVHRRILAVYLV